MLDVSEVTINKCFKKLDSIFKEKIIPNAYGIRYKVYSFTYSTFIIINVWQYGIIL